MDKKLSDESLNNSGIRNYETAGPFIQIYKIVSDYFYFKKGTGKNTEVMKNPMGWVIHQAGSEIRIFEMEKHSEVSFVRVANSCSAC